MSLFVKFALCYLAIVCVLTWFRDEPFATTVVLISALLVWGIKRGWIGKFARIAFQHPKAIFETKPRSDDGGDSHELLAQWNKFIDGAQVRPLQFYAVVEEKLAARQIPKIRCSRICMHERGPLSPNREYLKIRRKNLEFYICGAPFGTGFFVSSRLLKQNGLTFPPKILAVLAYLLIVAMLVKALGLTALALIGTGSIAAAVYLAMTRDGTPYEKDMAESFRRAVHNSLLEAIDDLTKLRPIASRPLNPSTPLMAELFP
jgi:hypothetical protein